MQTAIKWIFSLLFFGSVCLTADDLPLMKNQLQARHHAGVEQTGDGIVLKTDSAEWDSGLRIEPPSGKKFDFSHAKYLAVDVENLSKTRQMRLTMHISSGKSGGGTSHVDLPHREVNTGIGLNPGEKRTMRIYLPHAALFTPPEGGRNLRRPLDTSRINWIEFKMQWPFEAHPVAGLLNCRLSHLRLEGEAETGKKITGMGEKYFPFLDVYGQYKHRDWPEKIHSDAQLRQEAGREREALAKSSVPASWDRFGGWKNGPVLKATGSFRTENYQGKWFLVDPEGHLFWSNGIDVLRTSTDSTRGTGHEKWFSQKVPSDGMLPFTNWNLAIKFGKKDYEPEFYRTLVQRLGAWGINTIGNWGAKELMLTGKIPYTLSLSVNGLPLLPKTRFYDVFDPAFENKAGNILRDQATADELVRKSIDDPMCIGYFIDNELAFDKIMTGVLQSGAGQPAKVAFVDGLKAEYGTIAKLNAAWKTGYPDWSRIAAEKLTGKGKSNAFHRDVVKFKAKFIDRYFRICAEGIKKTAPHRLYLGCRFVGFRQSLEARKSAVKYCDVVSVNTYTNSVANVSPKSFSGKPILIGEFHFGTYDRGMFSPGLCPVWSQKERATSYIRFLQGALVHPDIVGAHYFQFRDQPLTGRWDGEGYQIGFVDVADTPYPEMTGAAREVGEDMYSYRMNGKFVNPM